MKMNNISLSIIGSGYIARKVLKELSSLCQIVSIYSTNKKTSKELITCAKMINKFDDKMITLKNI